MIYIVITQLMKKRHIIGNEILIILHPVFSSIKIKYRQNFNVKVY